MAKQNGVERVFVHCFMDGRDTLPTNGAGYIEQLQQKMREYNVGQIASVSGRYYAMDRDKKWDREKKAFDAMVFGDAEGGRYTDAVQGVKDSYNRGVTDEFIIPFVLTDDRGEPLAHDSRRRRLHQLQLPRRPRAADHALPGPQQPLHRRKTAANWKAGRNSTASSRATASPKT